MAMIKCPECGKDVSSNAAVCPTCGSPIISKSVPIAGIMIAVISGIVLVIFILFIGSQNRQEQAKRNLDAILHKRPSFVEKVEAEQEARRAHDDNIYWLATNGIAEGEFEYATNLLSSHITILTNAAIEWLHKAAKQDYQPAKDLLLKLE